MINRVTALTYWNAIKSKYAIYLVLIAMIILAAVVSPVFLSMRNLTNIARQISVVTIMALGQTLVIITGMIDLSVGSVMALAGIVSVAFYVAGNPLIAAVLVGVLVGVGCAAINGLAVTKLKVPPFIATLGMLTAARGLALLYTRGQNIYQIGGFTSLGQGSLLGIPTPIYFMVAVVLLVWYLLNHTRTGRWAYAVGGNEEAARASGVRLDRTKLSAFLISGAFVGLAGVLFMSRVNAGLPAAGVGWELDTISIAVIGGTSITGGTGTAMGTLAGAFIIGVLNNIMNLMGVQSYLQQIIRGTIIVLAVAYDMKAKSRRKRVT